MLIRQSNPPANRKYLLRLRTGAFVHEILTNVREKAEEEPADMGRPLVGPGRADFPEVPVH